MIVVVDSTSMIVVVANGKLSLLKEIYDRAPEVFYPRIVCSTA